MASGKSFIGIKLAKLLGYKFTDLDHYIEKKEQQSISDIFKNKGELYFRKKERFYLNELLNSNSKLVIATGGGTPCYYDNMNLIKNSSNTVSIYIKATLKTLVKRVKRETLKRPLIAHLKTNEQLTEFIGKHLFERNTFYNKANLIVNANNEASTTLEDIILKLF